MKKVRFDKTKILGHQDETMAFVNASFEEEQESPAEVQPPGDKHQAEREQPDQGQSVQPSTSHVRQSSNPFLNDNDLSYFSSLPQDDYKAHLKFKGTDDNQREAFVCIDMGNEGVIGKRKSGRRYENLDAVDKNSKKIRRYKNLGSRSGNSAHIMSATHCEENQANVGIFQGPVSELSVSTSGKNIGESDLVSKRKIKTFSDSVAEAEKHQAIRLSNERENEDLMKLETCSRSIAEACGSKKSLSSLRRLFASDSVDKQDRDARNYACFLQILEKHFGAETLRNSFKLAHEIKETDETSIVSVLMIMFWVRIHCMILDKFKGKDSLFFVGYSEENTDLVPKYDILMEMTKIFRQVFDGNTCLSRFNKTCCNCICIECVKSLYRSFFLHCYMRFRIFRLIYELWPTGLSTCCIWIHYIAIIFCPIFAFMVSNTSGSMNIIKNFSEHGNVNNKVKLSESITNITRQ